MNWFFNFIYLINIWLLLLHVLLLLVVVVVVVVVVAEAATVAMVLVCLFCFVFFSLQKNFSHFLPAGIYFELTDSLGHRFGPGSKRLMEVITDLDPIMGYLADSMANPALDDVNLVIVSDHGMTSVSENRVINLVDAIDYRDYESLLTDVAVANIYTKPQRTSEVGTESFVSRSVR